MSKFWIKPFFICILVGCALGNSGCSSREKKYAVNSAAAHKGPSAAIESAPKCQDADCKICGEEMTEMSADSKAVASAELATWVKEMLERRRLPPKYYLFWQSVYFVANLSFFVTYIIFLLVVLWR